MKGTAMITFCAFSLVVVACAARHPVRIISEYGSTSTYLRAPYAPAPYHEGVDIAGSIGDEVIAAADGVVLIAGMGAGEPTRCGIGIYATIPGSGGYRIRYCHLSRVVLQFGDDFKRGELIGYLGATGNAGPTPHVHYEIRQPGGGTEDPLSFTVGCFNPSAEYKTGLVLTYPVKC